MTIAIKAKALEAFVADIFEGAWSAGVAHTARSVGLDERRIQSAVSPH